MTEKTQDNRYKAFILAAGFGTRLRPYTDKVPKPMVEVNGRSLIYRTLDKLRAEGIVEVVVNAHYKAGLIKEHMQDYMGQNTDITIHVSEEEGILDTGGGVSNALHYFDEDKPFYVIAGDNLWEDEGEVSALGRLKNGWEEGRMDIFTLMQPVKSMGLTKGVGDYDILDGGEVKRSLDKSGTHMWTNIRLNHPRIYKGEDRKAYSFLELMDLCEQKGRFFALENKGAWHHISTPADLEAVDAYYRKIEGNIK